MARYGLGLCLLVALGCAGAPEQVALDLEAERTALMAADAAWFESHQDVESFLASLADDAVFMAEGIPAARGEAIRTTWESTLAMPGLSLQWQANSAHVSETGDLGYTIGTYRMVVEQDGVPMVTSGKYVTIWKKQADGSWKVAVDCFNSDGPPSEA